ncbi:MAG: hypothetical protein HY298_26370 [Verrucomicrobia bacterium]|nr:hypothetical protein [Verrucomicrobiota bacterium]
MQNSNQGLIRCGLFFCLGITVTLVGMSLAFRSQLASEQWQSSPRRGGQVRRPQVEETVPPWGHIEFLKIPLINPDEFFPDRPLRLKKPEWFFENFSEERLREFLLACDLSAAEQAILLDHRWWNAVSNGCVLLPPTEVLWSLNGLARQQIYSTLGKSPRNYPQTYPFRFPPDGLEKRFSESRLSRARLGLIRKLTYSDSGCVCFADLQLLCGVFAPREFAQAVAALYQVPAYRLRLRMMPDSDVDSLVKYWGKGGREKIIKPLLDSLAHVPGGASISVSSLLPPFARLRLYTFPDSWDDPTTTKEDCLFTALNFFNRAADTNLFNREYAGQVFHSDYVRINDEPTLGDLVVLFNPAGEAIHCCVYIAADFVFTKNGINNLQPWVLMRISDMTACYPAEQEAHVVILRRKTEIETATMTLSGGPP